MRCYGQIDVSGMKVGNGHDGGSGVEHCIDRAGLLTVSCRSGRGVNGIEWGEPISAVCGREPPLEKVSSTSTSSKHGLKLTDIGIIVLYICPNDEEHESG